MIQHFKHNEIDREKWDACINQSPAEKIYARSWYLDAVCPNWEALVEDDYKAVMPLPVKQKWGIRYAISTNYLQQLGVFGNIDETRLLEFIQAIPSNIKYLQIGFNEANSFENSNIESTKRDNFTLNMNTDYALLYASYSSNTKRNFKKAASSPFSLDMKVSKKEIFQFLKQTQDFKNIDYSFDILDRLIDASFINNVGRIWATRNKNSKIIAAIFWIQDQKRSYYLRPTSNKEGKDSRAMFFLVDAIIQSLAGKEHVLDFEGSSIDSIAQFYAGFGATKTHYWNIKINRLPWPLNRIKP